MTATQCCTGCHKELPITREFFGNTPSRGFRRKCRKCMAAHTKEYDSANPESARRRSELRRDREYFAGELPSDADLASLRKMQRDLCAYCMEPLSGTSHIDHMIPLAQGGTNNLSNLVFACFQCNTEKHAKSAEEYYQWRSERGLTVHFKSFAFKRLRESST